MSISGGLHRALERGAEAGCDLVQVFVRPNRAWRAKPLTDEAVAEWEEARARTGVEPSMAHGTYLVNLGSPDAAAWKKGLAAFADEYERCGRLKIPYLVFHPGAHMGEGEAAGLERIASGVRRVLKEQPENATVLLAENTAGQGTNVGYRFEHLRDLLGAVDDARLAVCIDTCHTLAAGYDLASAGGWEATFAEFERVVGCDRVRAFHVNDSKAACGSRKDRHEHLGRGALGLAALRHMVNDARFRGLPMALETPKAGDQGDQVNLAILRALDGLRRVGAKARRLAEQPFEDVAAR
jgi:deoxyribonuclease-4